MITVPRGATSLQSRIILYLIPLLSILISMLTLLGMNMTRRGIMEQMQRDGVALARSYALSAENAIILGSGLGRVTGEASRSDSVRYLGITDDSKIVIAHTDISAIGKHYSDAWIEEALSGPITAVQVGAKPISGLHRIDTSLDGDARVFRVVVPLVVLDRVVGALDLGLDTTGVLSTFAVFARQSLAVAVVGLAFGAVYAWFFARIFTNPIGRLAHAVDMIACGDLEQEVSLDSRDEIGRLAMSFNHMARSLRDYMGSLKQANAEIEARAETIRRLMSYTEDILASIPAGVITVDPGGTVTVANTAAKRLLAKADAPNMVGEKYETALSETPTLVTLLDHALARGVTYRGHETNVSVNGIPVTLIISSSILLDRNQQPLGVALAFEDVTELRGLQRQINETAKLAAVGELSAGLAHELRNPLGAIKACSQFLEERHPQDEPSTRFTSILVREVDRLNRLVERLLGFARPKESDIQYINVHEVLDRMIALVAPKAKQTRVEIVQYYQATTHMIFADPEKLSQVFLNIMLNSIDAMPHGGVLAITTTFHQAKQGDIVRLDFRDTGVGIPREQLEKVFTPFFTTRKWGTGLGLAIAQRIVSEHGGEINVDSKPGIGTAFSITLPAGQILSPKASMSPGENEGKGNILGELGQ